MELLKLGVRYVEHKDKTDQEKWNEKFDLLKGLLNAEGECSLLPSSNSISRVVDFANKR